MLFISIPPSKRFKEDREGRLDRVIFNSEYIDPSASMVIRELQSLTTRVPKLATTSVSNEGKSGNNPSKMNTLYVYRIVISK